MIISFLNELFTTLAAIAAAAAGGWARNSLQLYNSQSETSEYGHIAEQQSLRGVIASA